MHEHTCQHVYTNTRNLSKKNEIDHASWPYPQKIFALLAFCLLAINSGHCGD